MGMGRAKKPVKYADGMGAPMFVKNCANCVHLHEHPDGETLICSYNSNAIEADYYCHRWEGVGRKAKSTLEQLQEYLKKNGVKM